MPWEDVFASIEPTPLAAGTIGQVHRATLENGEHVIVKVQRPSAREEITRDLGLLELFAEKALERETLRGAVDIPALVQHLSDSLRRELDFTQEAANIGADARACSRRTRGSACRASTATSRRRGCSCSSTSRASAIARSDGQPGAARGGRAAARGLLPADPRGRLLPRRPAPRQPALDRREDLPARPRHGRRARARPARAADPAAARVLAQRPAVPRRDGAAARGRGGPLGPRPREPRARVRRASSSRVPGRVAPGHADRADARRDDPDREPPPRPAAGVARARRQGVRAGAARDRRARSDARPVPRRRHVPRPQRARAAAPAGRPAAALLRGAEAEGAHDAAGRGDRARDGRPAGAEAPGRLHRRRADRERDPRGRGGCCRSRRSRRRASSARATTAASDIASWVPIVFGIVGAVFGGLARRSSSGVSAEASAGGARAGSRPPSSAPRAASARAAPS